MADGEDDDEPGNDVVHPVRDHLAAEHDIDPAKEHAADVVWLRHVVHGKAREDLDENHHVEADVRRACQRVAQVRVVARLQQHVVQGDVNRIAVEVALPDAREETVTRIADVAVDAQDERCAERKGRDEVYIPYPVHGHGCVRRLNAHHSHRLRDQKAGDEQRDDRQHHDPMENPQKRTEQVVDFPFFFFHSTIPFLSTRTPAHFSTRVPEYGSVVMTLIFSPFALNMCVAQAMHGSKERTTLTISSGLSAILTCVSIMAFS